MSPESLAKHQRSHLFLLALIVVFAAAIRIFSLSGLGYWTDEFCTLSVADGWGLQLDKIPLNQITPPLPACTRLKNAKSFLRISGALARDDAHPPLYFLLLRIWEQCFGDGEFAVRSLNVASSLLAIVLLFFVARESVGSTSALVSCLMMAVATPQIQYAQEARNYMPVLVFLLLAAMAIQQLRRSSASAWAWLLGGCLLAMMLTHYFAAGAAVGLVGYALLALRGRARKLVMTSTAVAGIAFVLLWGPSLLRQRIFIQHGLNWLSDTSPGHLGRRLMDLCRLPVRYFAEITDPRAQIFIAIAGAMMLLSLPIIFIRRRELRMWIAWLVGAIALVAIADVSRSTTQLNWVRYTLFATPAAYVLLAAAIMRGSYRFVLPAIAVVLGLLALPTAYVPPWKKDFRTPIEIIARQLRADDGLVIIGPDPIENGIMYAAFDHYLPAMPRASAVLTPPPDAEVLSRLEQCPKVWVIQLWPQPFAGLTGFKIEDSQSVPYFATMIRCRPERHNR